MAARCTGRREDALGGWRDGVETPLAWHALQLGHAAVVECDSGSGDEVLYGLRDKHLSRRRPRGDAGADRDGDAGDLVVEQLALARVEAGAQLEVEGLDRAVNRLCAADRARRPVERCKESVAGGVVFDAAEARELRADRRVVAL